jgi:long-chain acyl-CoA synthetase
MYPGIHARRFPDKPAVVMGSTGDVVTYGQLNERSNRLAQLMWAEGLRPGDHITVLMENHPRYFEVVWAGLRSGLYVTPVNRHLTADEAAYVVDDSQAQVLVTSRAMHDVATAIAPTTPRVRTYLMVDGVVKGYESYEEQTARYPAVPLAEEPLGEYMLYSSGTTGKPKGIIRPLPGRLASEGNPIALRLQGEILRFTEETVYLSPGPLYHSTPLTFAMATQTLGGTAVVMERFDPEQALELIERHRITHSQWVPTMFSRMLKLPDEVRGRYDLSSHQVAIHGAAPCSVSVKEQMIDWWGPILEEFYGGSERNGYTIISSREWLAHKGSVGRPRSGTIHVVGDDGEELPADEIGLIYFEQPARTFEYFNDPEQTTSAVHPEHAGWSTLGDVGYVDGEGYLYLTDRASFMIVSGGVNIYPQEIEGVLAGHPEVLDVAVFGVPNADFGEETKAIVKPAAWPVADADALAAALDGFCREHLASYKCPRSYEFEEELPRLATGKLYKRALRDRYWQGTSRILQ